MTFDPTKPVQTRDGRPARIICTDRDGDYPIVAIVGDGAGMVQAFSSDGRAKLIPSSNDLINVPKRYVRWVNVYKDGDDVVLSSSVYDSKHSADQYAHTERIACVCVEFSEGDGLKDKP